MKMRSALVSAAVLAMGCSGSTITGPSDVVGVTWQLKQLQRAGALAVTPPAGSFFLRFADQGRVDVRADCNACGGTYTLTGARLTLGPLACTRAFCPSSPFDTDYVQLAEAATAIERSGEVMILRSTAGMLRFTP